MHDLIYDVINYCVRSCDPGKMSEIVIENARKDKDERNFNRFSTNDGLRVDLLVCYGEAMQRRVLTSLINANITHN